MPFGAPGDVGDDAPLPQNCEDIHRRTMWIVRGAHSHGAEVAPGSQRGDHREQKDAVPGAGNGWPVCGQVPLSYGD
jgi:hypothetical protein